MEKQGLQDSRLKVGILSLLAGSPADLDGPVSTHFVDANGVSGDSWMKNCIT